MTRIAIVLFNLGGPDSPSAVKPFLFNLFKDRNIIRLPAFVRYPLGWLISTLRNKKASKIYEKLGGKSPINEQTYAQADALQAELAKTGFMDSKVFIAMRYWKPFTEQTVRDVQDYAPDKIVLLPLYPQLSTTTTKSSFEEWDLWAKRLKLTTETYRICCYPTQDGFVTAYADLLREKLKDISEQDKDNVTILFSAHGIPQDCVDDGDPYEEQVKLSVDKIMLKLEENKLHYHHKITYQSKVGPKKWLEPDTESEIETLAEQKKIIAVVPIAFVSEHSETLVELDMDYRDLALEHGAADYIRIPTVTTHPSYIKGLHDMALDALEADSKDCTLACSAPFKECHRRRFENYLRY